MLSWVPCLGKAWCHVVRMFRQSSGEAHLVRNAGFLPTASLDHNLVPHMRATDWNQILQPQSGLQMSTAPASKPRDCKPALPIFSCSQISGLQMLRC